MSRSRMRWQLVGPWRIADDPDLDGPPEAYVAPDLDDASWREIPPATHIQPWLYPDNPYWGPEVRAVNDRAWWYRVRFPRPVPTTASVIASGAKQSPTSNVGDRFVAPLLAMTDADSVIASEAKQSPTNNAGDRFVAPLLAMTDGDSVIASEAKQSPTNNAGDRFVTPLLAMTDVQQTRMRLVFEAVDYHGEVWLNGRRLGAHEGSFAPFAFDVTDLLQDDNLLTVRVTAPWDRPRRWAVSYVDQVARGMVKGLYAHQDGLIPPDANPIGIWRPVWLEAHGDVTIERVAFDVAEDPYDRSARLTLRLHVHNRRPEAVRGVLHVRVVLDPEGHPQGAPLQQGGGGSRIGLRVDEHVPVELAPGEGVVTHTARIADPHWWWPWDLGHPDLYRLECTLHEGNTLLDSHQELVGLRQVELLRSKEALHYQINGVPVFLRGTSYMGALYLSQLTPDQIEADLQGVRACGLNLIRLHVHVAPPEVYAACDRLGIMIWQDFELNWLHDPGPAFEERALQVQREMVALLQNHASIVTWAVHNEPTALPLVDVNLNARPDPRLYRELQNLDPSRPSFLCSGKQEVDWRHSGDTHAYLGGGHGGHYTAAYGVKSRLVTEFGCEAPPTAETLDEHPLLARRLAHVRDRIDDLHAYQAALVKYQIEWYRRTRFDPCGGYVHFMFVDAYPQVGCGVLDAARRPRPALDTLRAASQPVHVMLEYAPPSTGAGRNITPDAAHPVAVWVVNDRPRPLFDCLVEWEVCDQEGRVVTRGAAQEDVPAQRAHRVALLQWKLSPQGQHTVRLCLTHQGQVLDENVYHDPFSMLPRPQGYPWQVDPLLGMRCYGGPFAVSSLRVFNTWYGRLAQWLFPVYEWAEAMLAGKGVPSGPARLLTRLYRMLNSDLFRGAG